MQKGGRRKEEGQREMEKYVKRPVKRRQMQKGTDVKEDTRQAKKKKVK